MQETNSPTSTAESEHGSYLFDWRRWLRSDGGVAIAVGVLAVVVAAVVLGLWNAYLRVPLNYAGDALSHQMIVQSLLDSNWVFGTDRLGAPLGQVLLDFPTTDQVQYVYYAFLAVVVGGDIPLAINLGYLGTFGIIAALSFLVLRQLGMARSFAVAGAVLYAMLPYHFARSTFHLFLSGYMAVPLVALVLIWQTGDRPVFQLASTDANRRWTWRDPRGYMAIVIFVVVALTGTYYAVFGGLLLGAVALLSFGADRDWRRLIASLGLLIVLATAIVGTMLPTIVYAIQEGPNPAALVRSYFGVELYGLRIVRLFLPIGTHRVEALRQFAVEAAATGGEQGENLGVIGAVGLVASVVAMGTLVLSSGRRIGRSLIVRLGLLNVLAILLGTVAGIGALLGLLGLDEVRAWNRIVVYIGFFSIAATMVIVERWSRSLRRVTIVAIAVALVVVGTLDQTSSPDQNGYQATADAYWADAEYFQAIEAALPVGAAVFQLPYVSFPEVPPVVDMGDYAHVRGYLHTKTIRWSFGGMKGRTESEWQVELVNRPMDEFLAGVVATGFDGLYIDRFGYVDRAVQLESEIVELMLGVEPIVSRDGRLAFYDMSSYRAELVSVMGQEYLDNLATELLGRSVS